MNRYLMDDPGIPWRCYYDHCAKMAEALERLSHCGWQCDGFDAHADVQNFALELFILALGGMSLCYGSVELGGDLYCEPIKGKDQEKIAAFVASSTILKQKYHRLRFSPSVTEYLQNFKEYFIEFAAAAERLKKPGRLSQEEIHQAVLLQDFFRRLAKLSKRKAKRQGVPQNLGQWPELAGAH